MDVIRLDKVGNLDCRLAVETTLAARFPCEWAPCSARPGARGFQKGYRVTVSEDRSRGPCPGGPLNMHMSLKSEGTLPTLPVTSQEYLTVLRQLKHLCLALCC